MLSVVDLGIVHRVEVDAGRRPDPGRDPADLRRLPGARADQGVDRRPARGASADRSRSRPRSRCPGPPIGSARPDAPPWPPPGSRRRPGRGRSIGAPALIDLEPRVPCPHCGSRRTVVENLFGPTQCRTIRYCADCRQPFEVDQARLMSRAGRRPATATASSASSVPGRWGPGSRRSPSRRAARSSSTTSTTAALERGRERIRDGLARRAAKLGLDPDASRRLGRRPGSTGCATCRPLDGLADDADLVIESALEDLALKRTVFRTLDDVADPDGDPGHQHERALGRRDRRGDGPAGAASSACTSSTPRRSWRSSRSSRRRWPTRRSSPAPWRS